MNQYFYHQYLKEYIGEAIRNSNGTNAGISEHLWEIPAAGRLSRHREEKQRALQDARAAFSEHRHWPREIILKHLGIEIEGN